jgi:hypothetical protein
MKKLTLLAAVVCLISFYGMDAFGQTAITKYVGPSSTQITGGARPGQAGGMNQQCIAAYGTGAHMCTVDEFYITAGTSTNGAQQWVQPVLHNCVFDGTQVMCQEAGASQSVPEANYYFTCGGWTLSSGDLGTTVAYSTQAGWVLNVEADCSVPHKVACCK